MPPLELEGCHLGEKHKSYNALVKKATKGEALVNLSEFNEDDDDITNLLKIDKASHNKNVEYILKVLACNDMLYVSKVLKQCHWLLIEKEYEHIVNPQYLHETLFPRMCTKASIKLIKILQRRLKDAPRVEKFYEYEDNVVKAVNWLPHCSQNFIEHNLPKHVEHMRPAMLRRLCERSVKNLQVYIDSCPADYMKTEALETTTFLIRANTLEYLDIDEKVNDMRSPKFSPVATKILMKTCPNRIIDNFEKYCNRVHLPTFIQVFGTENVKDFLLNQALKAQENKIYLYAENFKVFVESIPVKERFQFIKKVFIDKEFKNESSRMPDSEKRALKYLYEKVCHVRFYREYTWYKHAPFDVAFNHFKKMVEEASDEDIKGMLNILISCASKNVSEICNILQYVKNSKKVLSKTVVINDFVKNLLKQTNFKVFNSEMWNTLQDLANRDCNESLDTCSMLTWALISNKVINSEKVPDILFNVFEFDTLKRFQDKFNISEKQLIFEYLYEYILTKLQNKTFNTKDELKEWTVNAKHALQLLIDWDIDLNDCPVLLDEIKRNIKNNINNNYNVDLSFIYNMKKSWKKYLFRESLYLCQNDYTLINSLKHDPSVLQNYVDKQNHTALIKIAPVRKFLRKIRVFYPTSIGKSWFMLYNENISNVSEHKTICFGISTLSSRAEFEETLMRYAPKVDKIDNADIAEFAWSLRSYFAKTMHFSRPQPTPALLLPYAKGDYLKYALPSLFAIFYNLSVEEVRKYIPQLLDSQVSLQKHGIRLAFARLPSCESSIIFEERWKSAKNLSIRCVLFKVVFELLCKEKNEDRVTDIWNLLKILIGNLTLKENDKLYDLLFFVKKLPSKIQAPYYMHIYNFLKKLSNSKDFSDKYSYRFNNEFVPYASTLMDRLSPEFVTQMLLEFINEGFNESSQFYEGSVLAVMSSFCLNAMGNEGSEVNKYTDIFIPFHKYCIENNRKSTLSSFLDQLRNDVSNEFDKKNIIIPLEMLVNIQKKLQETMPLTENYIMLTKWNLTVSFLESLQREPTSKWDEACSIVASRFGKMCSSTLKEHCTSHFSYIYVLFSKALKEFLVDFIEESIVIDVILNIIDESVESYLVAIKLVTVFSQRKKNDDTMNKINNLKKIFSEHTSAEVKIHYYRAFGEFNDCFGETHGSDDSIY